jgi:putative colanic acid biosynthesis UDP-glucose lipid carrier transferase
MAYFIMNFVNRSLEAELAGQNAPATVAQGRKWPIRYESIETSAIVFDLVTIALASVCASIIYRLSEGMYLDLGRPVGSAVLVWALFSLLLKSQGLYKPAELLMWRRQLRLVLVNWIAVFLLLSGTVFALKIGSEISRGTNMLFAAFGLFALAASRTIVRDLLTKGLSEHRFSGRKVVLIADPEHGYETALNRKIARFGLDVVERFALPPRAASANLRRKLTANVIEHIRGSDVEEVVVAADLSRWPELRDLAAELRVLPFPITLIPTDSTAEILHRPRRDLGDTTRVELQRGPLSETEHAAKRLIDVVGAGMVLFLLLPLLAVVALAIRLDSRGPILFRQQRLGFNGRSFKICKFRTMSTLEDGSTVIQACPIDARVTRIGKWLRRTSIDELPQLFNVLAGSMSLVGPRPHAIAHDNHFDKLVRNYAFRRRVKPGLTGWAQINGSRGPTPTTEHIERRIDYDLWYIDNWRLGLDLAILIQTPLEVLRGRNAY